MFRSQLFDHLQGVVLRDSAITNFSACLRRLFGMWLYVVCKYMPDAIQPHTKQTTQASREVGNSTSTKDDPLKMVKQL